VQVELPFARATPVSRTHRNLARQSAVEKAVAQCSL